MSDAPSADQPVEHQPASAGYTLPPETEVVDVDEALHPMRVQIVGLGAAFIVVSLAFSAFVYKQSNGIQASVQDRNAKIEQMRRAEQQMLPVLNELAGYSVNKADLMAIFGRYGLQIGQQPPAGTPPAPAK